MRRLALLGLVGAVPLCGVADAAPAPVETITVRGVVRDQRKRPLSNVQVACKLGGNYHAGGETRDDGVFVFERVPIGQFRLEATLLGTPEKASGPDVKRSTSTSASSFDVVIDAGEEVVFRPADGARFEAQVPGGFGGIGTALWVQTDLAWKRWHAGVQGGGLAFRRVQPGSPWFLYVAWNGRTGTCFRSGERLPSGDVSIDLEPGLAITGKLGPLPQHSKSGGGPARDNVVARRGPVTVDGWVHFDGSFATPPLPSGAWRVTGISGSREVTVEAPAGAVLDLVLP